MQAPRCLRCGRGTSRFCYVAYMIPAWPRRLTVRMIRTYRRDIVRAIAHEVRVMVQQGHGSPIYHPRDKKIWIGQGIMTAHRGSIDEKFGLVLVEAHSVVLKERGRGETRPLPTHSNGEPVGQRVS